MVKTYSVIVNTAVLEPGRFLTFLYFERQRTALLVKVAAVAVVPRIECGIMSGP
jgi:uncharacterized membrane protein